MNKSLLLVFFLAVALCQKFELDDCSCDSYPNYYAISCPVSGLPSGVKWTYSDLPTDWYATNEVIYAPRGKLIDSNIYGVKLQILSGTVIKFKKSLLFSFLNSEIRHVTDFDYDFTDVTIYNSVISNCKVVNYPTANDQRKTLIGGILGAVIGLVGAVITGVAQILTALGGNIQPYFPYGPKRTVVFRGNTGSSIEYQLNPLGNLICGSSKIGGGAGLSKYSTGILGFKANMVQALLNKKYPY